MYKPSTASQRVEWLEIQMHMHMHNAKLLGEAADSSCKTLARILALTWFASFCLLALFVLV